MRVLWSSVALLPLLLVGCASAAGYKGEPMFELDADEYGGELMDVDGSYMAAKRGDAAMLSDLAGGAPGAPMASSAAPMPDEAPEPAPAPEPSDTPEVAAPTTKRLVIYTGDVGVLVANVDDARQRFLASIEAMGGYLERQDDEAVTVRVPAAHFTAVVDGLVDYGMITHRRIDAVDVTKRVFELGLRIENAEKARARLLALLADAREMKDILAIESELRRLTDEIELFKGELRNLKDQIAFSTLTVAFQSNAPPPVVHGRRYSRFPWINVVGAENVQTGF